MNGLELVDKSAVENTTVINSPEVQRHGGWVIKVKKGKAEPPAQNGPTLC